LTSLQTCLPLDGGKRTLGHLIAEAPADGHSAGLGRVLELPVATAGNHLQPTVIFKQANDFPNRHCAILPEASGPRPPSSSRDFMIVLP
jgi:hypothetical protein